VAARLEGRRVVVLLAEGFEDLEFWVTVMRLREEGAKVTVAGATTRTVHGKHGLEAGADVEFGLSRPTRSTLWWCRADGRRTSFAATTR
jgi:putative intracellular protease/amidase